jgi:hypothetical protein
MSESSDEQEELKAIWLNRHERKQARTREYLRERYHRDPEYRESYLAYRRDHWRRRKETG